MYYLILLTLFTILMDFSISETPRNSTVDLLQLIPNDQLKNSVSSETLLDHHTKQMWFHHPTLDQYWMNKIGLQQLERVRSPQPVTKLAKTLYGFDPYFDKENFEPFESRPKPITLVAFRKHGLAPRRTIKHDRRSTEVAELQSPYNPVSIFWLDSNMDS